MYSNSIIRKSTMLAACKCLWRVSSDFSIVIFFCQWLHASATAKAIFRTLACADRSIGFRLFRNEMLFELLESSFYHLMQLIKKTELPPVLSCGFCRENCATTLIVWSHRNSGLLMNDRVVNGLMYAVIKPVKFFGGLVQGLFLWSSGEKHWNIFHSTVKS
jgi:hypothetical protein